MVEWIPRIGDEVAIYLYNHNGKRTVGTIVHEFEIYNYSHYVVEVECNPDNLLEVRSNNAFEMIKVDRALSEAAVLIKGGACHLTDAQSAALFKALKEELDI